MANLSFVEVELCEKGAVGGGFKRTDLEELLISFCDGYAVIKVLLYISSYNPPVDRSSFSK